MHQSLCQISRKSVKRLQRYGDLTVFKMAAVRHPGFVKFKFLAVAAVKRPICIILPNFVKVGQTVAEISRFFVIFKMADAAILDFKIRNFNGLSAVRDQYASLC